MSKIIALANQKGGVGKTTTAVNLGIGLARQGKKVLLVDADAQGNLTDSLGWSEPDKLPVTLATLMTKIIMDEPIESSEGILHHAEGVDIMPANIELSAMEVSLVNTMSREIVLRNYLNEVRKDYDFILIDCMTNVYRQYLKSNYTLKPPTLKDLYEELKKQQEPQAKDIALSLEMVTNGNLNVFAHQTNVDVDNRLIAYGMGHAAMIMMYCGLRRGELLALTWEDIDLERKVLLVNKSASILKNQTQIKKPKSRAGVREVPIPNFLADILRDLPHPFELVCPDAQGDLMTGTAYYRAWNSYLHYLNLQAGGRDASRSQKKVQVIDHITAHMFRHTYASMLYEAGVDIKSAQRFLGHADIEMTLAVYTHLTKYKEAEAISSLNAHLDKITSFEPVISQEQPKQKTKKRDELER